MLFDANLIHYASLGFTDALDDHLLCSLSRNTSRILVSTGDIAESFARLVIFFDTQFISTPGLFDLLDSDLIYIHFDALSVLVKQNIDIIRAFGIIAANDMACLILSYMYSLGIPFSFSRSSIAEKNSAFIFNLPLLYYMVTCSLTCAICSFLSSMLRRQ